MRWIAHRMTVRRAGYFSVALLGGALGILLLWQAAWGAAYVNPFFTNNSASPETAITEFAYLAMTPEHVDARTGELLWDLFLFDTPGLLEDHVFSLRWRSMVSGKTQFGAGMIASFETTAEKIIVDACGV